MYKNKLLAELTQAKIKLFTEDVGGEVRRTVTKGPFLLKSGKLRSALLRILTPDYLLHFEDGPEEVDILDIPTKIWYFAGQLNLFFTCSR